MFIPYDENRHLYEGLTRHNYFPNQKEGAREIPSIFSTLSFTPEIAELLVNLEESKEQQRKRLGYDQVSYSLTRHNNVPRELAIPHPKPYAHLVKTIHDNWGDIRPISENEHSIIKPYKHADGRMLVMNYEEFTKKVYRSLGDSFSKRFRVNADVASCFHSIYSHSIPWAVLGFEEAKKKLADNNDDKHWSDWIDIFQRKTKRNETQGVAIGPGSSSVVVELVLGAIDKELNKLGCHFERYIDDYICYCETYEEAQDFIRILGKELNKYKLNINLHKTSIVELPEPATSDWVSELMAALPAVKIDNESSLRILTLPEIIHYLDMAVRLNKSTPDGSVIKYAVGSILRYLDSHYANTVLTYVINLSWHYPTLLPYLDSLLDYDNVQAEDYREQLNSIIIENAKNGRSDGVSWPIYLLNKHGLPVSPEAAHETISSEDCISILCLYASNTQTQEIIGFANDISAKSLYDLDRYWLLLYHLYKDGHIPDPYNDGVFDVLNEHDVDFMPADDHYNITQQYCTYFNNPFIEEGELPAPFNEWKASL